MLKLPEAIRLGALLSEQCFGLFWDDEGRTCAWGAAFQAVGLMLANRSYFCASDIPMEWDWCQNMQTDCPECDRKNMAVRGAIAHLNDEHKWTREEIAEFVETIEPVEQIEASEAAKVAEANLVEVSA